MKFGPEDVCFVLRVCGSCGSNETTFLNSRNELEVKALGFQDLDVL